MTNHQPVDARPSAWVGAHERIIAAQKLKMDPDRKGQVVDPLPELYWATLAEAAVLADLARAPGAVGFGAGAHFAGRAERIVENNRQIEELLRRTAGKRKPTRPPVPEYREQFAEPECGRPHPNTAPFAVGHRVRVVEPVSVYSGRTGRVSAVDRSKTGDPQADAITITFDPLPADSPVRGSRWAVVSARDVELIDDRAARRLGRGLPGEGYRIDEGDRVRVTMSRRVMDGKYAGRTGTVTKIGVDDGAGWIEVELDQMEGLRYASRTVITVRADVLDKVDQVVDCEVVDDNEDQPATWGIGDAIKAYEGKK